MNESQKKKLNYLLFISTFIAGIIWWGIGEIVFSLFKTDFSQILKSSLLIGAYFACLTLIIFGAYLFSDSKNHFIVNKYFFKVVVMGQSLKKVIIFAFVLMFSAGTVLNILYKINIPQREKSLIETEIIDYYFLLDNTTSLTINDPYNERFKILERFVDEFDENRKIALITFGNKATINIHPAFATNSTKNNFKRIINNLVMESSTNIKDALQATSSILQKNPSRREVIIFFTDGEDTLGFNEKRNDFRSVLRPFISNNVPVYTIFLNPENTASTFLRRISDDTGGIYSTVRNPIDIGTSIEQVLVNEDENISDKEPFRNLLGKRIGVKQYSLLYGVLRIVLIALIGLLMGYLIFIVISNKNVFTPMLLGGGVSGLLAGLVLELGLQTGFFPDSIVRLLACIILSTMIWLIGYSYAFFVWNKYKRAIFACFDNPEKYPKGLETLMMKDNDMPYERQSDDNGSDKYKSSPSISDNMEGNE